MSEIDRWNAIAAATADPQTQGPWPENLRDEWRKVLAHEREEYDSGAFPLQRGREQSQMTKIASWCNGGDGTIMEIGADKGGGLLAWLELRPQKLIANEVRGCPSSDLVEAAYPRTRFLWSEASIYAPATVEAVKVFLAGDKIDVLFIDGNKAEFRRDFDLYRPLMRPGGVVFMHDIQDDAPGRAFRSLSPEYVTATIIDTTESAEVALRFRQGIEPASEHERWLLQWGGRSCGVGVVYIPE